MANSGFYATREASHLAGRTYSVTDSTFVAQTLARRSRRREFIANRRSVKVLSKQCCGWGGTNRDLGRHGQRKHGYPHFAQSPSTNATGTLAPVNRSPL